LPAIA